MPLKRASLVSVLLLAGTLLAAGAWWLLDSSRRESGGGVRGGVARAEIARRLREGLGLARDEANERALAEFEAVLALAPQHSEALFQRGRLRIASGESGPGLEDLHRAVELAPDEGRFHRYLLELHELAPAFRDAVRAKHHYEELRRLSGELIDFDLRLDNAIVASGSAETFQIALELLARLRPSAPAGWAPLYEALFPAGYDAFQVQGLPGFARLAELLSRQPGLTSLKETVAMQLANPSRFGLPDVSSSQVPGSTLPLEISGRYIEELLDVSVHPTPSWINRQTLLALHEMKMGDFRAARVRLSRYRKSDVSDAVRTQNAFFAGVCAYKLGDLDRAREDFREVMDSSMLGWEAKWYLSLLGDLRLPLREESLSDGVLERFRFREVAGELGVDKLDAGGTSAWGDVDLDGDLDLYVSGCDTFSALYHRVGDRFEDASVEVGLAKVESGFTNVLVDYDGDGDEDLFIARDGWAGPAQNALYQNQGDGTFRDVTAVSGIDPRGDGSSFTSSWADFDRDGNLDVFIANGICADGSTIELRRNLGGGRFEDFTAQAGLREPRGTRTIGCAVGDYDLDGAADIFLSGVAPTPNRLYHNRGDGTFDEVSREAGVDDARRLSTGFVAFIEDLSGDGLPDLLMTKWEPSFRAVTTAMTESFRPGAGSARNTPRYFRNRGDGTFEDRTEAVGLIYPHGTMGAGIADLDQDGFLDIYLANGGPAIERLEPDSLYINRGGDRFVDIGRRAGMGHLGKGHGVSFADLDSDGDLDVYVPIGGAFHGDFWRNVLYRNEGLHLGHWLQLDLRASVGHPAGIGAQVLARAGALRVYREKRCGIGFGSGDSPWLHLGVGEARSVRLEVRWPSGRRAVFEDVAVDRRLRLVEDEGRLVEVLP